MEEQLKQRLESLKAEFESGQQILTELEMKQTNIRETLLRISGAIQVIEEELGRADEPTSIVEQASDFGQSLEVNGKSTSPTPSTP